MTDILSITQSFVIGALLVYITIPVVVKISKVKKLLDIPDERKVNTTSIPNLGGVALFFGISTASFLSLYDLSFTDLRYIMVGVTIMFFIGVKDDILNISARKKFIAQLIAALLIIIQGNIRFTNLHGVFGLYEINYFLSVGISTLAILAIINAVNLIDGIDGLASAIGLLISTFMGVLFWEMDKIQYAILCFAMAGSLVVFYVYNVYGKENKIFMGDTGSLIIGIISSVIVIKFNEFSLSAGTLYSNLSPALSLAILSLPIFDMLRVFVIRLIQKKSPFVPDMNHIHHKFLAIGFSHMKSTMVLLASNLLFIGAVFLMIDLNVNYQLIYLTAIVIFFSFIPNAILAIKTQNSIEHKEQKLMPVKLELLKKIFTL